MVFWKEQLSSVSQINKGAEATIYKALFFDVPVVIKYRNPKHYRVTELDEKLRRQRTINEARMLHRAKQAGVKTPYVVFVDLFSLFMTYVEGKRPSASLSVGQRMAAMLAKLHAANIIHGDFSVANVIQTPDSDLVVIDFGLSFFSRRIEDKATDLYTFLKFFDFDQTLLPLYEKTYRAVVGNDKEVEAIKSRLEDIEKRGRYK